jgi:transposase-like protein
MEIERRWKCYGKHAKAKFTLKTGTIFEDSPLPLDKWLVALWLVVNCKNGISSMEIARHLGITQKSAWFMAHRLRLALHQGSFEKLSGRVEVDETYIGAKARNMSDEKRRRVLGGDKGGLKGKVAVQGLLERTSHVRHSKVKVHVVDGPRRHQLVPHVEANVEPLSQVYTDALRSYDTLSDSFIHKVIDHAEKYVEGEIHTNGLENFWSLLKRSLNGTYVNVEPFHLFRYLDEQAYRFNNRKDLNDYGRFRLAASQIVGRRLTWKQVVGSENPPAITH